VLHRKDYPHPTPYWIRIFCKTAFEYLRLKGHNLDVVNRLLELGRRRWKIFFGVRKSLQDPFMNLKSLCSFDSQVSKIDDIDQRVAFLRLVTCRPGQDQDSISMWSSPLRSSLQLGLDNLSLCLKNEWLTTEQAFQIPQDGSSSESMPRQTLDALSTAGLIYESLPEATVSTGALDRPLIRTRWASATLGRDLSYRGDEDGPGNESFSSSDSSSDDVYQTGNDSRSDELHGTAKAVRKSSEAPAPRQPRQHANASMSHIQANLVVDRGAAFACIAYLESGSCDIDVEILPDVFALCCGDSMYAAAEVS